MSKYIATESSSISATMTPSMGSPGESLQAVVGKFSILGDKALIEGTAIKLTPSAASGTFAPSSQTVDIIPTVMKVKSNGSLVILEDDSILPTSFTYTDGSGAVTPVVITAKISSANQTKVKAI
jgi:hypothetical protein